MEISSHSQASRTDSQPDIPSCVCILPEPDIPRPTMAGDGRRRPRLGCCVTSSKAEWGGSHQALDTLGMWRNT